jgi:hypothetical protein
LRGSQRANLQASFPPAVRCRRSKVSAGKTTLEQNRHWWFNRQRELKATTKKTHNKKFAASAADIFSSGAGCARGTI